MAKRKQRLLQDLYNVTHTLSQPKITPILRENYRMQGPVDESDCDFHTNMVPPEVDKEYSSYSNNSKSDWRIESGTCNVCSAPCSSCLHINQHHMGSKVDECSGEASAENALSVSVNDAFPNDKIVKCETVRKSQTRNFVSKDSSNTSENVDSEATFRNSDLSATSSNITVLPKVEDPKGQEDHADHQSCVTGAEDTRLSNSNVRNGDSMDFPSYPVSANCLIAQEIVKTVCRQTSSGCLDMRCDFNESQNNFCRQSENIEEILKELPLSVCSPADLSSENLGLVETPVETAGGVTDFMKVQGSLSHPVLHKSPSSNPSGHLSSVSVMDVTSDSIHGDSAADYIGENECTDKIVGSRCLPTAKENSYEFHSMDESDDSDMVEDVKVCDICGDAGREDLLAICCRCTDGAEHTYCMREMVDKVPVGDWLCEECKFDVEMKNHMQEKLCSLDGNEKINSSGQANPEIANFSTKSEAKGSDVEGNRNSNDPSSMKVLGKRHSDDTEVSCAAKKRVLEPDISSAKISTTSGLAGISRDSSFKHLDRGKAMPTQISSSGTSLAPESESSPALGSRLQTPQGTLIKSYSFNSLNVKPKVKLVDDVVPQKQRSVREHASLGKKEGVSRSIGKSMPFNVTNSARLSIGESKVKMLSPKFSHRQEAKGSKDTNDRNLFDRKNSFRSEQLSGSPSMCKSGTPAANQKLVSSGEPNSLSSARSFYDTKGMQSDSRSLRLSKSLSFAARRGSELPGSLGGLKRQSSASVLGVSSVNGNSSHDLKPNQDSPNEDSSSSSRIAERSICNSIEGLPDGLSQPKEATNFGERANDSIYSRSKQSSMISGRIISCQKCKEIGHSAQFCTADHPKSPVFDATAAKKLSDTVDGKDKLKAAIEAAVLRKPGIYRKHRVSDQSNDVSVSNINSEVATQDQLSDSSNRGNMSSSEEMQKKQMVLRSSVTESCEQETVDDDVKQFPVMSIEASTSITGHGNPVALLEGPSLVRGIPTCDSPSTLLRALAIPDHQYIWQGIFEVHRIGKTLNMFDGIQAHLSTSASPKVLEAVNKFAYRVLLNEVPRFTTWPVQFQESGVKEDNVALFFFAKDLPSYEKSYRLLLDNMMKNDLALKGSFDGFELMIFPSNQLPEKFQRWNTLFFLWGVFRGKRSNCSQHVPGSNKQFCISHGIPTAIMSLPKNLCSLWPIDKGLAAGGRKALASEVAASELHCLSSSQALNEGCGSRVLSEVINNDPVEQPDNSSSFPFVQNSISKSCEATVHASNLCDERRHTSTSQEGGVDSAKMASSSSSSSSMEKINFRTKVLSRHLNHDPDNKNSNNSNNPFVQPSPCLSYTPPELSEPNSVFDVKLMRKLMDGHNIEDRDWLYNLIVQSKLFNPKEKGGKIFVLPDYNQSMEQQREMTMKRIEYLLDRGVFEGWLTNKGPEAELRKFAFLDVVGIFDHSLAIKLGVHFFLWGSAIQFFGTKRHHDKWLKDTENYVVKGCFSMTELGHGSNVRGIETITTYDSNTGEFVINTPCESAQKYWIGGAANHATHTIVFSQLNIDGRNQGVHAFIAQIRDANGNICPNIRIADCGHKIGLNGVDNGRLWFDNVHIPRENLLNSVADVSSDGQYLSAIKDPDQRFAAFLAPLTSGRVTIAVSAIYQSKISLAIAIRYSLTRRAFSVTRNGPEVLLLDYPSHQRRLLPLLAKTYAMSFAADYLKTLYVKRTPELIKTIHIVSSAFKATLTWHNMRTLQECREACGGQGMKTENRVGHLKGEYDVQSTFEGDNNVLMQQVSKTLLAEYVAAKRRNKPFKGLGLEHMNKSSPVIPSQLTSSVMRSTEFQNDILCVRERDLLNRFASEISLRQTQGESKEHAFVMSYQLAEDLGRAFSDRAILQTFMEAETSVTDGPVKSILGLLRAMYALVTLEEDSAFLRYGYLSIDNAASVRKEVAKLCSEMRPHALSLVSSFGIPDAFLSPIAFNWIEANSWSSVQN